MNANLLGPLGGQFGGLLALDPQRRGGQDHVALVERLGPLDGGVDDGRVHARHLVQQRGDVRAVDVDGVHGRVAVGELLKLDGERRWRLAHLGRLGIDRATGADGQFGRHGVSLSLS